MTTGINNQTALLAIAILQPCTAEEVRKYLANIFSSAAVVPTPTEYAKFIERLELSGRAISFQRGPLKLYSLTTAGTLELSPNARRVRDKRRLFLLRDSHKRKLRTLREVSGKELAGASPATDTRSSIKVREAKKNSGLAKEQGRNSSWPRILWQFKETGPASTTSRDTFPPLLSFANSNAAAKAIGQPKQRFRFDLVGLGTVIGVSPKLIAQITLNPARHYRSFEIAKKAGGKRQIESPRVFLKVIQWVLLDFVLINLKISEAAHAFRSDHSIVSNALPHTGQRFVAGFDIKDFFGSITTRQIKSLLQRNGFLADEAELIATLCTKDGVLPQGAPTSPVLSNAFLFDFDEWAMSESKRYGFIYTRYADDITVSSASKNAVEDFIERATDFLKLHFSLRLNKKKTRISGNRGRQVVTGAVVNVTATPPRDRLRQIRAIFHNAQSKPRDFSGRIGELAGLIGFLNQFPKFHNTPQLKHYVAVLAQIRQQIKRRTRPSFRQAQ